MGLTSNTEHLHQRPSAAPSSDFTRVEYHLQSWRELYDKSIVTADRYSSGAARWVIHGGEDSYDVTVVSRPYYALPQQLCLSFDCYYRHEVTESSGAPSMQQTWLPVEEIALEFSVLLSVFAREPIVPLGLRREGGEPIIGSPYKVSLPIFDRAASPAPIGINSRDFVSILASLVESDTDLVQAIIGAAKFYHAGLSLGAFDPSVAYVSFVSAIECLAGYQYKGRKFSFDEVPKFEKVGTILGRIGGTQASPEDVDLLKEELIRSEHFTRQKFVLFCEDFVTNDFWALPDELYSYDGALPEISRESFSAYLKEIYDARSGYLHGGVPYPEYVDFGLRERLPSKVFAQLIELQSRKKFIPPIPWFERLCHVIIIQFLRHSVAPDLARQDAIRASEREQVLEIISGLPASVNESLKRLVKWTAKFLPIAVINPHAPNSEWADSPETIAILKEAQLIDGEGDGLEGTSWLKDRPIGEIVGEFFFGAAENPFRDNELLLPGAMDEPEDAA